MEQIQNYCKELSGKISSSKNGHLSLSHRVRLMRLIKNPALINKIMFECAKKVYPVWIKDYPDDSRLAAILQKCDEYLYHSMHNKKDFSSIGDDNKNYDNNGTLDYFADDPDELLSEFKAFPRKKEFTPDWWQKILGRKAKYLK
jgi:hypothetical protein